MTNENDPEVFSLEGQLRALTPTPASTSEAQIMYACGYRAGMTAAQKSASLKDAELLEKNSTHRWTSLLLAACIACIVVGPAAYWMGRQNAQHSQGSLMLASSTPTVKAPVPFEPAQIENEQQTESHRQQTFAPSTEDWQATVSRLSDRSEESHLSRSQTAFSVKLTSMLTAWLGNSTGTPNSKSFSSYRYLTSRTIQDSNTLDVFTSPLTSQDAFNELTISSDNNSPARTQGEMEGSVKQQQLGYIESLRNISSNAQNPSLLQWLN